MGACLMAVPSVAARPTQPVERTAPAETWRSRSETWGRLMAAAQGGGSQAYARLIHELDVWLSRYYARRLPHPAAEHATCHSPHAPRVPPRQTVRGVGRGNRSLQMDRRRSGRFSACTPIEQRRYVHAYEEGLSEGCNPIRAYWEDAPPANRRISAHHRGGAARRWWRTSGQMVILP
jgi:hypothetical protein